MLGNVELSGEKIEIDIHDLSLDEEVGGRIIHCAQLLLNTWFTWKREEVSINYFAKKWGKSLLCFCRRGDMQRNIRRKKEKAYLAEKFHSITVKFVCYIRKRWIFQDFFGIIILD